MNKQKQSYIYALIAIVLWSTAATAFKIALKYLDFIQVLCYSSFTSIIVLFFIAVIQKKLPLLKSISKEDLLKSSANGFLNPFLYYMILLKAYSLLDAQIAQPLNYTWPIMLVLLSVPLLKQKLKLKSITAIFISFIGVLVISSQGKNILEFEIDKPLGVVLASSSSIVWALFWIFNVRDKRDEIIKLLLNFIFAFIYILLATLLFSEIKLPQFNGLLAVIYIGFFEMGITFALWLKALQLTKSNDKISNLVFISPFLALIFIHLILGENIFTSTIAGLILIIFGIFVQQFDLKKLRKK